MATLYIFGGLPGTGKSTLSAALAKERKAVYLRLDTIEQAIRTSTGLDIGPEGYEAAYALASDNLSLGLDVVADSVNPLPITRNAWRNAARVASSYFVDIEIVCSDTAEHRRRVEKRQTTIRGLTLPTWQQVLNREYVPWASDRLVIDTASESPQQSIRKMMSALK